MTCVENKFERWACVYMADWEYVTMLKWNQLLNILKHFLVSFTDQINWNFEFWVTNLFEQLASMVLILFKSCLTALLPCQCPVNWVALMHIGQNNWPIKLTDNYVGVGGFII